MIEKIIGNIDLLVAILGVLSAILIAIIAFFRVSYQIKKNSKATLDLKLREEKSAIYDKVYSYIFDLLKDTLAHKELDKVSYTERYMELKQLLLFNASDRVLKHFIKLNFDTSIIRKTIFPHFPKRSVKNRAKILKRNGCSKINLTTKNNKECSQSDCILCV